MVRKPDPVIIDDLYNTVKSSSEHLRDVTVKVNEISEQYRSTVVSINDKLILLSAGSISLLLTFVGILFNSERDVSGLDYQYIVASIVVLLLTIVFLLLSRWLLSLSLFSTVMGFYFESKKDQTRAQINMFKARPSLVKPETYEEYSDSEIGETVSKGERKYELISTQHTKVKKLEKLQDNLFKIFAVIGYCCFVASYLLAILFFVGVMRLMQQ